MEKKFTSNDVKNLMDDEIIRNLMKSYNGKTTKALMLRGYLKFTLKDYKDGLEDLDKAHKSAPNDAIVLKIRGSFKNNLKDYNGALMDLNKAIKLGANDDFVLKVRKTVK